MTSDMWRGLVVAVVAVFLLAGCTGSDEGGDKKAKDVAKPTSTVGQDDPSKAKLLGVVVDDEELPIPGAQVGLRAAGVAANVTTDDSGGFAFLGIEPGTYLLLAQKLGYEDFKEDKVLLTAGSTLQKTVKLIPLPSNEPFAEVMQKKGVVSSWGYKTPGPLGEREFNLTIGNDFHNAYHAWTSKDKPKAMENMVGELVWGNTQVLAGKLYFNVAIQKGFAVPDKNFIFKEANSPVKELVTQERIAKALATNDPGCAPEGNDCKIEWNVWGGTGNTNADVDFALTMQQPFEAALTIFYRMPAPEGYGIL